MSNSGEPRIHLIILNWNGKQDTLECLQSVFKLNYHNYCVVVVDNGSTDDSIAVIRQKWPAVKTVELAENRGFSGGNNEGIRFALADGADYVLLLNNDTVVDPELLSAFVSAAGKFPSAGMFNAKISCYSDPRRIWFAVGRWSNEHAWFSNVGLGDIDDGKQFETVMKTDFCAGCALLARREVIETIGLLDDRYFLMYEDNDWSYRARAAGYECLFVPQAKVLHKGSVSFGGSHSPMMEYYELRNVLVWGKTHLPLKMYLKLWRSVASRLLPPFHLRYSKFSLPGNIYWSIRTYGQEFGWWWRSPVGMARRVAVKDYLRGRLGRIRQSEETSRFLKRSSPLP